MMAETCSDCKRPFATAAHEQAAPGFCNGAETYGCLRAQLIAAQAELAERRWIPVGDWPEESGCVAIGCDRFYERVGEVERRSGAQRWAFVDSQKDDCDVTHVCALPNPPKASAT